LKNVGEAASARLGAPGKTGEKAQFTNGK